MKNKSKIRKAISIVFSILMIITIAFSSISAPHDQYIVDGQSIKEQTNFEPPIFESDKHDGYFNALWTVKFGKYHIDGN